MSKLFTPPAGYEAVEQEYVGGMLGILIASAVVVMLVVAWRFAR